MTRQEIIKRLKEIQAPLRMSPAEWANWYKSDFPETQIDLSDNTAVFICMAARANMDLWELILKLEMEEGGAERG